MNKISILYPNNKGSWFDFHYYIEKHMPRSIKLLSAHPGFKGVSVDQGLSVEPPGTDAIYIAMCHFLFDTVEDFVAAFMPHAEELQRDMLNYTDIKPVIQFNEVLIYK
jgi:uncharacterized protein (TIGR02118 family)